MTDTTATLPAFALEAVIDRDVAANNDLEGDWTPYEHTDEREAQLSRPDFVKWCAAFDICPVHQTDIEICLDDDLGCGVHGCDCPTPRECSEAGDLDPTTLEQEALNRLGFGDDPYDEADNA